MKTFVPPLALITIVFVSLAESNAATIYETDFTGGLPDEWSIVDGYSDGKTWTSSNPESRSNTNWTGTFMIVDSDWAGFVDMDEELITPSIDCSAYTDVTLKFRHYFMQCGSEICDVDVRVSGGSWQNVVRYQEVDASGLVVLDLSSIAGGQADVQIRWHYYDANYDYYWGIDDVEICSGSLNPPHDACVDAIAVVEGVPYDDSTVYATGVDESSCGDNDTADVWHSFTPGQSGDYIISLCGSMFDTTLAVYVSCGGMELACNDDSDSCGLQSEVAVNLTEGNTYLIRIAGYDGDTGDYTLTVTGVAYDLPSEPNNPTPTNGANDVANDTILSWNGGGAPAGWSEPLIRPKIIYGADDRLDEYQVTNPALLAVGDSTVALVSLSDLTDNGDGTFSLPPETYAEWYLRTDPIWTGNPLCPNEPFRNQPNPAWCSGFLVAPDIVATAGHCITGAGDCADVAFVFGFVMLDATTPVVTIDASQIYFCSEIISREESSTSDWGLIRLDREVTDHIPVAVRRTGAVPDGEELLVIGHPVGLPRKYADGATVRSNTEPAYFEANLDTYAGNSGSVVFDTNTLQVEGVMVRGNPDFEPNGPCDSSNVCPDDTGCPRWEDVTRSTEFSSMIPSFDVHFGTDPCSLGLICPDVVVSWCDPGPLECAMTYYWRVVAKNECGETSGPIWSFTTESVLGDFEPDCDVDLNDLAELVRYWLKDEPSVDIAPYPTGDGIINFKDFAAFAENWLVDLTK